MAVFMNCSAQPMLRAREYNLELVPTRESPFTNKITIYRLVDCCDPLAILLLLYY